MIFNKIFKEYIIENNLIENIDIELKEQEASSKEEPLFITLTKDNLVEEEKVYRILASFLNIEYRFVQLGEIDLEFIKEFDREVILENQFIPLKIENDVLELLITNPFRIEEARILSKEKEYKRIKYYITPLSQMKRLLDFSNNKINQDIVLTDYQTMEADITEIDSKLSLDAPIIKLCDSILKDAINRMASDIHIEPFEEVIYVRFRIDGKLILVEKLLPHLFQALLARFKIMAELNIAERRVPQDGKISLTVNEIDYDFRVSTIPTIHGEKIVIRIYNKSFTTSSLSALGFNETQTELILNMIKRPHGIILLTGPTGSGKSTTLYTFLRYLNNEETNIMTVEDPVENVIEGINQVQVNPKANLTFAAALRSFLRQDPNVIMVGEIRDEETAQIATRAAITGHLVLSSIHTNDASGVITRLINMGIPKYLVADSLLGAISQRLVRKLCPKCKKQRQIKVAEMKMLGLTEKRKIYDKVGCPYCNNTGYMGRIGVFEIMVLTDEIRDIIMSDDFTSEKISDVILKHTSSILDHTKERVLNGETSLEEYDQLVDIVKLKK